jgi:nitrogen fixation protein FixH
MKRGLGWPIGMGVILATTMAVNIAVMFVAKDDPSFAVEKDYYRKAVEWDHTMEQERHNQQLGWRVEPVLDRYSPQGGALLHVRVTDSTGAAIPDATVQVAALYNARAGDVFEATLQRERNDTYTARLPVTHTGQWELRFTIVRGADRFTAVSRVEAIPQLAGS